MLTAALFVRLLHNPRYFCIDEPSSRREENNQIEEEEPAGIWLKKTQYLAILTSACEIIT